MKRQIIKIDADTCNGCGACVNACHEGAIGMINGKAVLLRDDYCDGLGNCLPGCPTNAITFEEREALPFNEEAVTKDAVKGEHKAQPVPLACGCPGTQSKSFIRQGSSFTPHAAQASHATHAERAAQNPDAATGGETESCLMQWPVQIKLVPINAPYFAGANLLVAADCSAFAYASFHQDFIRDHITIIGCPKLDSGDYTEKLTAILTENDIKSLTIVRMEVPCCGGLANAATEALRASGKFIPWQVVTITTDGKKR